MGHSFSDIEKVNFFTFIKEELQNIYAKHSTTYNFLYVGKYTESLGCMRCSDYSLQIYDKSTPIISSLIVDKLILLRKLFFADSLVFAKTVHEITNFSF